MASSFLSNSILAANTVIKLQDVCIQLTWCTEQCTFDWFILTIIASVFTIAEIFIEFWSVIHPLLSCMEWIWSFVIASKEINLISKTVFTISKLGPFPRVNRDYRLNVELLFKLSWSIDVESDCVLSSFKLIFYKLRITSDLRIIGIAIIASDEISSELTFPSVNCSLTINFQRVFIGSIQPDLWALLQGC